MCVLAKQGIMLDVILLGPASLNLAVLFKLFVHKTIWSMKDINIDKTYYVEDKMT